MIDVHTLQVEKEFVTLKMKVEALETAKSTFEASRVCAEEEAEDSKRLRDQAMEETKEAQDRMNLQKARINNMTTFAVGIASTAQELNHMALEVCILVCAVRTMQGSDVH